ncbi:branched-chain amino acid ABC transporter permease [Pyrobaculum aerophilum]|uniref:Branched-chain amino acid transport permease protein n=2 Tax=Pyrobaculum aerophilum TaxID=13773 RepID=Q8ZVW9_PYRAE|nr:branched-chain amino acid ABC transporter permease [Pyrobaculum aerophilum]AAL63935.1 branched-chain amino acid transport permease protein [Pyrobaculum aerophilum str. IM2]MCX8137516.1 branched-chain amino acid ABC transporter permease [Pyrobaculum aerophilum]HII46503.1 branched-chain amino acid ABC transporter permease [Pyrobaculum aerophilum]
MAKWYVFIVLVAWIVISSFYFPREVADALVYASVLVLASVGLTLTYQTTKVPNFAHGVFINLGVMAALTVAQIYKTSPYAALPLAVVLSTASSLALYFFLLPLYKRQSPPEVMMMATMAYNIVFIGVLNAYADWIGRAAGIFTRGITLRPYDVEILGTAGVYILAPLTASAISLALYLFLKTKIGTALRAAVENEELARTLGINVERMYAIAWAISGAVAGVAGVFLPLYIEATPDVGWLLLASFFAASIVGGLNNIYGALAGGVLMGFVELLGTIQFAALLNALFATPQYQVTAYRPLVPLLAIAITLLISPKGLLGR